MAEYIEKQAAVSYAISGMVRTLPTNDGNENWIRTSEVRKNILSIPVANVVPVVHAHWIVHENADTFEGYEVPMFECSNCRAWKDDDSNFCPDCGAMMDEAEDENGRRFCN